jgi:LysM repeat protein
MSAVEGLPVPTASTDRDDRPVHQNPLPSLCPYLATEDGTWRSANAVRDHRCMAVNPPVPLALEKQRRLCLVDAHLGCATYGAAQASRDAARPHSGPSRPIARTTPVVLDRGRFDLRMPAIQADRPSGQAVLVGVLGVALAAILVARPSGQSGAAIVPASPSPSTTVEPTESAVVATPTASIEPTQPPASIEPTATPGASASAAPVASPTATPAPTEPATSGATYKVKSGDTLSAIAARFNTTVRVLVDLNEIDDPSRLKVGQVLKLP